MPTLLDLEEAKPVAVEPETQEEPKPVTAEPETQEEAKPVTAEPETQEEKLVTAEPETQEEPGTPVIATPAKAEAAPQEAPAAVCAGCFGYECVVNQEELQTTVPAE